MSRIGRKAITLPAGVNITVDTSKVTVTGPKGSLSVVLLPGVTVEVVESQIKVGRKNELKQTRAFHGLVRSLINNHVTGVSTGYKKTLKLIGTGYRVTMKGQGLSLAVGFSHPVDIKPVEGVKLSIEGNDTINLEGIDSQVVGQLAANIRSIKPPEPYKGKGIRYVDEVVRRKQGKAAA